MLPEYRCTRAEIEAPAGLVNMRWSSSVAASPASRWAARWRGWAWPPCCWTKTTPWASRAPRRAVSATREVAGDLSPAGGVRAHRRQRHQWSVGAHLCRQRRGLFLRPAPAKRLQPAPASRPSSTSSSSTSRPSWWTASSARPCGSALEQPRHGFPSRTASPRCCRSPPRRGTTEIRAAHVIDATGSRSPFRTWCKASVTAKKGDDRWCIADVRFTKHPPVERHTWRSKRRSTKAGPCGST